MNREASRILSLILVIMMAVASTNVVLAGPVPQGVIPAPASRPIAVKLATDRSTYAPGDTAKITITVDKRCYLYLYDLGPDRTVTLLYPNRFHPDPQVEPGTLSLPGKGYKFVIAGPEGEETLVVIAATAPVPLLVPDKGAPFRKFTSTPAEFATKLVKLLPPGGYSTAWVRVTIHQPRTALFVNSRPEGAKIYVNGRYVGVTPKAVIVPAGETTITLEKSGFAPYSRTVTLVDRTAAEIAARLRAAPFTGGHGMGTPVPGFIGIDLGADSVGVELGVGSIGVTGGLRFIDDRWLAGPELLLGMRFHAATAGALGAVIGGGIAVQERYTVLPTAVRPTDIVIEPETTTVVLPDVVIGITFHRAYGYLFAGYDLRRGLIGGIGISF